jgi:preprotein translocase subunit SecF
MQDDKDIKLTIAPTPAEESVVQENLASATVEEKIDKDLTDNAQETANMHDPTAKTLEDIMEQEAHESETQPPSNFSLSRTLGGAILAHVIQSQIKLVLLITLFLIIYITCRY